MKPQATWQTFQNEFTSIKQILKKGMGISVVIELSMHKMKEIKLKTFVKNKRGSIWKNM